MSHKEVSMRDTRNLIFGQIKLHKLSWGGMLFAAAVARQVRLEKREYSSFTFKKSFIMMPYIVKTEESTRFRETEQKDR